MIGARHAQPFDDKWDYPLAQCRNEIFIKGLEIVTAIASVFLRFKETDNVRTKC